MEPASERGRSPASRAFVVQFEDRVAPRDSFAGRVEHIESGRARRFGSIEELRTFVIEILEWVAADEQS